MTQSTTWNDVFPYDKPYEQQRDGIERLLTVFENGGVGVLEGACGTGKTLTALSSALAKVRNENSDYERVVCVTSVKQQIEAFENDIQSINENMPHGDTFSGMTVVGKGDLCAYTDIGMIENEDIYRDCNTLRDENRENDDYTNDANRWSAGTDDETLSGDNWDSPIKDTNPIDDEGGGVNPDAPPGCGFYAQYQASKPSKDDDRSILRPETYLTRDDILKQALQAGMCPHAVMLHDIEHVEVVVANYNHIFDPMTKKIVMDEIINDNTILVCDEAHGIIESVRGLYSTGVSHDTLVRSIEEISNITEPDANYEARAEDIIQSTAFNAGVSEGRVKDALNKLSEIIEFVSNEMQTDIERAMNDEFGSRWKRKMGNKIDMLPEEVKYPYRDPEEIPRDPITYEPQDDRLTQQVTDEFQNVDFRLLTTIANGLSYVLESKNDINETYSDTAARKIMRWINEDQVTYFRMLKMKRRWKHNSESIHRWDRAYSAHLELFNCLPREEIKESLNEFGGVVLMSATLAPLDAYKEITGINLIEEDGRYVDTMEYGLKFPRENRDSFIVDLEKYTSDNRGSINETTQTRTDYRNAISDFTANVDGNTLICMPSYSEAEWAGKVLKFSPHVDKEVLVDESSTNQETEILKERFFNGDDKVLLTSQLGTLTEGVDYDGDKLKGCLVVGVPIKPTNEPEQKAIKTTYEEEFGDWNGFAYSLVVPAVQKARQAIGRVIRGDDDIGVRGFADTRYDGYINQYLPTYQQQEFDVIQKDAVGDRVNTFFENRRS